MAATKLKLKLPQIYSVSEILKIYGVSASKKLSQNFILDQNVNDKFVRQMGNLTGQTVIEIGPGPGGLTRSLLQHNAKRVIAVELDDRFMPSLHTLRESSRKRLEIVNDDILSWDMAQALDRIGFEKQEWHEEPKLRIVGNLPFGISSPIMKKFIYGIAAREEAWAFSRADMTFLFQNEVALRVAQKETSSVKSRFTFLNQRLCDCKYEFKVPGSVFVPAPDVDGAVITIKPRNIPPPKVPMDDYVQVTTGLFNQKRKKCINGLTTICNSKKDAGNLLNEAGIDPERRPESFTPEEMETLVNFHFDYLKTNPIPNKNNKKNKNSKSSFNNIQK